MGDRDDDLARELAAMAEPAPDGLLATVLVRVGVVDDYVGVETALGPVFAAYNRHGVSYVQLAEDAAAFVERFRHRFGRPVRAATRPPAGLVAALETGRAPADLGFDLRGKTGFERDVLAKTREIPAGEVRSYRWVAHEVGRPRAVRAVGSALGQNPVPVLIPCHRVVRSDGRVGDYAFGPSLKRRLLQAEGVDLASR